MLKIIDGNGRSYNAPGFDRSTAIPLIGSATDRYKVVAHDLGNGHIEATAARVIEWIEGDWSREYLDDVLTAIERAREEADPDEERIKNRERAARRAKTLVRRLCKAMGADTLLTLTYRALEADLARVKADLKEFNRRMLRVLPSFRFVACFELQQRGAWHVHIATSGIPALLPVKGGGDFRSYNAIRAIWRSVTKERAGNIDVSRRRRHQDKSAAAVAAYIAKYVGKTFADAKDKGINLWTRFGEVEVKVPVQLGIVETLYEALDVTYGLLGEGQTICTARLDRWTDWFFVAGESKRPPRPPC